MVKRPKSPEIVEDARFFTVYQPYPLNPDWHEEDDQIEAAKWVAECIGPNHLWAIHEKPRAGNMILLEVSKDFVDHGLLLGEHRWAEFLKDPTPEEKPRVTQVFHSFYARGRDAQKDGWKVIAVNSRWLYKWAPGQENIKHPYPETHWCTPPVEDRTNKTLCRPLPTRTLPIEPPPRPPAPVVGSSTWVAKHTEASPTTKHSVLSAWSKPSVGAIDTKRASQVVERDRSTPSAMSPQSGTSAGRGDFPSLSTSNLTPLNGKNAWGKPVPLKKFVEEAAKANAVKGKSGWTPTPQPASPSGAKSPLAEQPPKGPVNAWANPIKIPPGLRTRPSPTPTAPSTRSQSPWSALETTKGPWSTEDTYQKDEDKEKNSNTPGSGGNSNLGADPTSPPKGRSGDLSLERESDPSRHKSSSRIPADRKKSKENDYDTVDFVTPQRDKHSAWDVLSPEPADKEVKGKKKANNTEDNWRAKPKGKDGGETMDFEAADGRITDSSASKNKGEKKQTLRSMDVGARFDWASEPLVDPGYEEEDPQFGGQPLQTPNVKPMDVDNPADYGERGPVPTDERTARSPPRQPKSWGKTGRPESPYKGKKFDRDSPRNGEFNSRDESRSRKSTGSPIKVKDLPPGRSDGQWDHSGFAELEPKKSKFDKPKGKFDKPGDKYDKPRGRNDDKPRDKYDDKRKDRSDKPKDKFDDPRDRSNKHKGKFDKPSDKKPSASSSKNVESFDWSTLESQVEDWSHAPPETDIKDKGKRKADENVGHLDFDALDWGSKPVHISNDATMEVDEPVSEWDEWGLPPSDTRKGKAKLTNTSKNAAMLIDTPEVDEWGPPPSPKKGSSSAMGIDAPEHDWDEWGPPPPSHLKKTVQSKVFRSDTPLKPTSKKKGKKVESERPKPAYKDSTKDSAVTGSKAPETAWGEWGPHPESKGSKSKVFKSETPKATPKNAAMEIDGPKAARSGLDPPFASTKRSTAPKDKAIGSDTTKTDSGEWGPPPSSDSAKEPKPEASEVDDYTDWGHAPHQTKKLTAKKTDSNGVDADVTEDQTMASKEDASLGKLEDWLLPPVSESTKDSTASDAKKGTTGGWGAWSTSAPTEAKKSPKKKSDDVGVANFGTPQGHLEDWGISPAPIEPRKPTKQNNISNDDISAEDWGVAPVPEASGSSFTKGDLGTKAEDWGLGPSDDIDESEFHPWEKNTTKNLSAWGSIPTDTEPYAPFEFVFTEKKPEKKKLKCPTHNYYCKPALCKDMARWVKEVEKMEKDGIATAADTSPTWKRDPNLPPTRPRGSKRGRRVRKKKEPPVIGRLRGFEGVDRDEEEEEDHAEEEANQGETSATAAGGGEDWQAPIGGNLEDWGVQPSMDAWG